LGEGSAWGVRSSVGSGRVGLAIRQRRTHDLQLAGVCVCKGCAPASECMHENCMKCVSTVWRLYWTDGDLVCLSA